MSKLSESERQSLRQLTISDAVIDAARLEHVDASEARDRFGITLDCDSAITFLYFPAPNGKPRPWRTVRCRQDKFGKDRKYLCPPGAKKFLYFAPCSPAWISDLTVPIMLVESEKAALAGLRFSLDHNEAFVWMGLGGVYGWSGVTGKVPTPEGGTADEKGPLGDLELCRQRVVYIWFDRNCESRPDLYKARKDLARVLLNQIGAKEVFYVNFPDGLPDYVNGPDDLLMRGDREFSRVLRHLTSRVDADLNEGQVSTLAVPDLPPDALDGRLGEICDRDMNDFCRAYAWPSLLAIASGLVLERHANVRTNIYALLVGPTHSGKTQAIARAKTLLGLWSSSIISDYSGSGEQFVKMCSGANGNARLFMPDEFGVELEKMRIDRSSLAYVLTRAFDQDYFKVTQPNKTKEGPLIFHAHLSILGGIVDDMFDSLFGFFSVGGFYDRVAFSLCPTGFMHDYRPPQGSTQAHEPGKVIIRPGVWDEISAWRHADPDLGRVLEIGLRAAVICAAWDRRPELTAAHLKPMKCWVDYQKRIRTMLEPNLGETLEGRITDKILRYLKSLPEGTGVTRRRIFAKTHMYRLGVTTAERVLRILIGNGVLREQENKRADSSLISLGQFGKD